MLRKGAIYFALFGLFLLVLVAYGWERLHLEETLKSYLVQRLQSAVGEQCRIDKVHLGLGSVHLRGVELAFRDAPYNLWIEDLRLGYSFKSLFKNGFDLQSVSETITLYKPRFTFYHHSDSTRLVGANLGIQLNDSTTIDAQTFYRGLLREYDFIERLTVSDGEIVLKDTTQQRDIQIAHKVSGWAYADRQHRVWFRLAGHVFESADYNMVLYGQLDVGRGGFDFLNVDLHNYRIDRDLPFFMPEYFESFSGVLNGHVEVKERRTPDRGFEVRGTVHLKDGQIKIAREHLFFEDIAIEADLNDWNLEINKASLLVNGSPMELDGQIRDLADPEFDLRLVSDKLRIAPFLKRFLPDKKLPFRGVAKVDVQISQSLAQPRVVGRVQVDNLGIFDQRITDFTADLGFENARLEFGRISGRLSEAEIRGAGSLSFETQERLVDFEVTARGDLTHELQNRGLTAAERCTGLLELDVYGPVTSPTGLGRYELHLVRHVDEQFDVVGNFTYNNGRFSLSGSSVNREFKLMVVAEDVFEKPRLKLEATNFENGFLFVDGAVFEFLRDKYHMNLAAEAEGDRLRIQLNGYRQSDYEHLFQIGAGRATEGAPLSGEVLLFPNTPRAQRGGFDLAVQEAGLTLRNLELGDWMSGGVSFSRQYVPTGGKLMISGADFSSLLHLLGDRSPDFRGKLYGRVTFDQVDGQRQHAGELWLLEGFWGDVGPLEGEALISLDPRHFVVKKLSVDRLEKPFLRAEGHYDLATREVDATVAGYEVSVKDVLRIAADADDVATGEALVQVRLKGKLPRVPVFGDVRVRDASLLMFHFDEVVFDFGDVAQGTGSYISGDALRVGRAVLRKGNEFAVAGSAFLPFKDSQELDVRLSGEGNFLSLLSDIDPFFQTSESRGELDLRIADWYERPTFVGSRLRFRDGYLKLADVAREVKNFRGDLAVQEEDYFLNIREFAGSVAGRWFSITNTRALAGLSPKASEPLRVAGEDLNLGALMLETHPRGVPVNIPGLMDDGELGYYSLHGRTDFEKFFVAGPWERPRVRGLVRIRDANIMFPFDEGTEQGHPLVRNILNNLDWDLEAISAKDTRYVKQFPTAVYVNMEVDEANSRLEFTGALKDSTFRINGRVESTRGTFEYFDLSFRVEKFGAEFNKSSLYPIVYGRAWTVVRDTSNTPSDVYLTLYTVDDVTNEEVKKGRWDRIQIKLSSEYPHYAETQTQLMATLGFSSENMDERAIKAVGYSTDRMLFRPLMRPIERQLERKLGLDVVRFSYAITRNFLDSNFNNEQLSSSLGFLRSSKVTLGKYLTSDLYLLYTGQLAAGIDYQFQDEAGVGLRHFVGLEYRLNPRWLLQFEYDYNTLLETHKEDKKVWLRHSFHF